MDKVTLNKAALSKILDTADIPEPDLAAKNQAIKAAVTQFESESINDSQVQSWWSRVFSRQEETDRMKIRRAYYRRQSSFFYGSAATALCLLVVLISFDDKYYLGLPSIESDLNEAEIADITMPAKTIEMRVISEKKLPSTEELSLAAPLMADVSRPEPYYYDDSSSLSEVLLRSQRSIGLADTDVSTYRKLYKDGDKFESFKQNSLQLVKDKSVSTFSIDVDTASYSFVRRQLNSGVLPQKAAVRVEELINYFDYDYPVPKSKEVPFEPSVTVIDSPWSKGKKLLHIGIKGYEVEGSTLKSNLVFLLDVSGSMSSDDKLPLVKNAMKMLLEQLNEQDTVSIVVYAGSAGTVLEPTSVASKAKILAAIERLESGGSTAGGEGIKLAYQLAEANFDKAAVNRIVLATDGDFNVGIANHEILRGFIERKREQGIYLSVLGFGQGNYNDQLMQALAQSGNGVAAYIDNLNEARKVLLQQANAMLFPIAEDVKIQIEFNPDSVADYRLVGYETRQLEQQDFNNDKVDAGDIGAGHTVTAIYEFTPANVVVNTIDPLRYQKNNTSADNKAIESLASEYAFLKLRYKLPRENQSRLIEKVVALNDDLHFCQKNVSCKKESVIPDSTAFATAVAAYGQLLVGSEYMGEYSFDEVIELAMSSKGEDPFGYRAEFINLARLAKTATEM